MTSYSTLKTSEYGDLLLVADETHLRGIYFSDCKHTPAKMADWKHDPAHPVLQQAGRELREYLEGKRDSFSVPMRSVGTEFQRKVWEEIARIPFGETITYGELAERSGSASAVRAAGTATGRNPLSIVIPCHRVAGKNGGLGGYAGGLERKRRLLALEANAHFMKQGP
jgi:methylated-DNA-[protein]-cysteine S-methyltransferase